MPTELHTVDAFHSLSPLRFSQLHSAANRLVCSHLHDEPPMSTIQCFCDSYAISLKEMRRYCAAVHHCTPVELLDWERGMWMFKEIEKSPDVKFLVLQTRATNSAWI